MDDSAASAPAAFGPIAPDGGYDDGDGSLGVTSAVLRSVAATAPATRRQSLCRSPSGPSTGVPEEDEDLSRSLVDSMDFS